MTGALRSITRAARESVRQKVDPDRIGVNWMLSEFRSEVEALESASQQLGNVYLTALGRDLLKACSRNPKAVADSAAE
jgi:hypothetical protein